ncbi:MAG: hypothetical protein ABSB23_11720, partial [Bryobacteraceae bacterium]
MPTRLAKNRRQDLYGATALRFFVAPAVLPVRHHDICDMRYQDICDISGVGFSAESRGDNALEEGRCA